MGWICLAKFSIMCRALFSGSWNYFLQTGSERFPVGLVAAISYILPQAIGDEQAHCPIALSGFYLTLVILETFADGPPLLSILAHKLICLSDINICSHAHFYFLLYFSPVCFCQTASYTWSVYLVKYYFDPDGRRWWVMAWRTILF